MTDPRKDVFSPDSVLDAVADGLYVVDRSRTIRYWNRTAEELTGFTADEVLGRRCRDNILNHVDDSGRSLCHGRCPLAHSIAEGTTTTSLIYLHHADGHRVPVRVRSGPLRDADGVVRGAVETFGAAQPEADARQDLADRYASLERAALTDELTGLANRRAAQRLLDDVAGAYAVLFVDVDHFKEVNDTYGHARGDAVLRMVARTLQACARTADTVARWGGEEFLVLAPLADVEPNRRSAATRSIAERLRRLVGSAWADADGRRIRVTVSIGAAVADVAEPAEDVVSRADLAMLRAKRAGRNRVVVAARRRRRATPAPRAPRP